MLVTSILSETFSIIRRDSGLQDQAMENCGKKGNTYEGRISLHKCIYTMLFAKKELL